MNAHEEDDETSMDPLCLH